MHSYLNMWSSIWPLKINYYHMKKRVLFFIVFVCSVFTGNAQLTLEDVIYGGKNFFKYYPVPLNVNFRGDSNELVYQRGDS